MLVFKLLSLIQMKDIISIIFTLLIFFLASCHSGSKKASHGMKEKSISVKYTEVVVPTSDVLNMKAYFLSASYQKDTISRLYGYNAKAHALDCYDLNSLQASQIFFSQEGPLAVLPRISGIFVCSPDSIWVYDASQSFLLINSSGEVMKTVRPQESLNSETCVLVDQNHAIATEKFYYDAGHSSLWFGVRDNSVSPGCFKVCEYALDEHKIIAEYPLQPSVKVGDVYNGGFANMNKPNITFTDKYILYNYPVESHVYVMDKETKITKVIEADSRYTKNVASKVTSSADYKQWERHGIENPHFYEVLYIPGKDMYVRLLGDEMDYDAIQSQPDLIWDRKMYLMVFNNDFSSYSEVKLPTRRYNPGTAWCALNNALLLFVENKLLSEELTENLVFDVLKWEDAE